MVESAGFPSTKNRSFSLKTRKVHCTFLFILVCGESFSSSSLPDSLERITPFFFFFNHPTHSLSSLANFPNLCPFLLLLLPFSLLFCAQVGGNFSPSPFPYIQSRRKGVRPKFLSPLRWSPKRVREKKPGEKKLTWVPLNGNRLFSIKNFLIRGPCTILLIGI